MMVDSAALEFVRVQLCATLAGIERDFPKLSARDLVRRIDALRAEARPYGLAPLERVARACEDAVGQGGAGTAVRLYLHSMRDAIGCDHDDAAAGDSLVAAIAARMAG